MDRNDAKRCVAYEISNLFIQVQASGNSGWWLWIEEVDEGDGGWIEVDEEI